MQAPQLSGQPTVRAPAAGAAALERWLGLSLLALCLALVVYKLVLVPHINVNWDEFQFLSNVYALARGELGLPLQGSYTHLFTWLLSWPGDEVAQVNVARIPMVVLLGLSGGLIWWIGGQWLTGIARSVPVFIYLSSQPVLLHGGSFRADSMLVFLLMLALAMLVLPSRRVLWDWLAGAVIGAAFVLTIKTVLFLPVVLALLCFREHEARPSGRRHWPAVLADTLRLALAAGLVAVALLGAHWLTMPAAGVESIPDYGARVARKALFDVPWLARAGYLHRYVRLQPLPWLLIAIGTVLAVARRRLDVAGLALALLPVAFYRNAFPYFYVVMLGPLCILAGFALQELRAIAVGRAGGTAAVVLLAIVLLGLLHQGLQGLRHIDEDGQAAQRELVSAVHSIFPEPVNYVDRCGMIASFRRVSFFMSRWGIETYRERSVPFMPAAIRRSQPAFVLVNSWALDPQRRAAAGLLPEDYDLIARFYPPYWGPLRVAGAQAVLHGAQEARLVVPFPGDYRLESGAAVMVDDRQRQSGDVIPVPAEGVAVRLRDPASDAGVAVSLFLAAAGPPPERAFPDGRLFADL